MIETWILVLLAFAIIPATNYVFRLVLWLLIDDPNQFESCLEDN